MVEVSGEILPNLCRLCLSVDEILAGNILEDNFQQHNKTPIKDRIFDYFAIKIGRSDGLPTNICTNCLNFINSITQFRDNVHKCEARLKNYLASVGVLGVTELKKVLQPPNINDFDEILPHVDDIMVTVVDPNQEYESSDDDFLENEYTPPITTSSFQLTEAEANKPAPISEPVIFNLPAPTPPPQQQQPQQQQQQPLQQQHQQLQQQQQSQQKPLKAEPDVDIPMSILTNIFLCKYCDMAFKLDSDCSDHELKHDPNFPYTCGICPFRCTERQALIAHIKDIHQNDKPYICGLCNKSFGRRTDLKKHTIIHTGVRPYQCSICSKSFSRNANLTKHLRTHNNSQHNCTLCSRKFASFAELKLHQRFHPEFQSLKCRKCNLMFSLKEKLIQHERVVHGDTQISVGPELHTFQSNSENLTANFNQKNQIQNQFEQSSQFQPDIQNYPMNQGNQGQFQSGVQSVQYGIPGSQFESQSSQLNNQVAQTPQIQKMEKLRKQKIQMCTICAKAFSRKKELQRHMAIHINELQFTCSYCQKKFNRKEKLIRHERTHEEKYPCTICKMVFSKQEALSMHLKVHALETSDAQQDFLTSLQHGFRPQLNFYNELSPEDAKITTPF